MSAPVFNDTRVPGTKIRTEIQTTTLVQADNSLVLIGHAAVGGGTATIGHPISISNFGDPVKALAECAAAFGSGSEIGSMVVAAINGVLGSTLQSISYPPIVCIPIASTDTSANLAATLASLLTIPLPFVALCYPGTDSVAMLAIKNHLTLISGEDRGRLGQFGSFGFMAVSSATAVATPVGLAGASQNLLFPWLLDSASTPANSIPAIASATAAVCAANGVPYNPLTDVHVGGLVPPVSPQDWHTPGSTGTEVLGLNAGLLPLMVNADTSIGISRAVTSFRPDSATLQPAYFDLQDWEGLYYFRTNCYAICQQPQFKLAKASDQKAAALNSEFLRIAKDLEALEIFQHVDKLAGQFVYSRSLTNRSAFVFSCPVNVVPGFYNKDVDIIGTTAFDTVVA